MMERMRGPLLWDKLTDYLLASAIDVAILDRWPPYWIDGRRRKSRRRS
jgi:hypothetical protein